MSTENQSTKEKKIEIYSTKVCPYCVKAKKLLQSKNVAFVEIDVSDDDDLRMSMVERANGKRTVPQIFIHDYHVGGCDDLYALDRDGKLDELLKPFLV
ncbi:MAG: glutaredoxin 3 [Candidatus Puniceispirillum sp.]|nr:glutaredoxin 3 [Candidatus Pelagibacter sp.]MBA4283109.1 glutaredoxin 3 [Candidatus Puniceispirillum sp.]